MFHYCGTQLPNYQLWTLTWKNFSKTRCLFGQRPWRRHSPVEHRWTFVCRSFCHSPPRPLRPVICPIRPEIYPTRPEIYPLRPEIEQNDGQMMVPLCSTGLCPLWGCCPASSHSNLQSCNAGRWVSLTTYSPPVYRFDAQHEICCSPCYVGNKKQNASVLSLLRSCPPVRDWRAVYTALFAKEARL